DLESPADVRSGQDGVTFGKSEWLPGSKLIRVVEVRLYVGMRVRDAQAPVPERTRSEGIGTRAADLEIQSGIRLHEALVGRRAAEAHFAIWADLRRVDHRIQEEDELVVGGVDDRVRHHAVEREAADQEQRRDP